MHQRFHLHLGRHHGRAFGRFGRGFGDGSDMGGRSFSVGRKLAAIDLQLLILSLLAEKPRHGYEIIKDLEERSKGFYVPSPGMVYPALTYLEEIGHATVAAEGARKLYRITTEGSAHLAGHRTAADSLLAQFHAVGKRMERMRRAMQSEDAGADEARGHDSRELMSARRELEIALESVRNTPHETQQRIANILLRAAADIAGTRPTS